MTIQEVINEVKNVRQIRRLAVLPYDLEIKDVFPEHVKFVTEFAKKTGDYRSLSATDIKIIALTYQLEKEHVGIEHLKTEPVHAKTLNITTRPNKVVKDIVKESLPGWYYPKSKKEENTEEEPENEVVLEMKELENEDEDNETEDVSDAEDEEVCNLEDNGNEEILQVRKNSCQLVSSLLTLRIFR